MVLFVVFRAEIVMTEDEIGDVGNRGVNQKPHCVESRYRLVVYSVGWLSIDITLRFAISGDFP